MNRDPHGNPDWTGEYPKVPPPPPTAYPPREGPEGVPEEFEPRKFGHRMADVFLVLAAAAASIALLGFLAWWAGGGR